MAWQDELIPTLQVMVGDLDITRRLYSDDRLEQLLVVAAKQVVNEILFTQTYTMSVENVTIAPDPTATATKDDSFANLITLKAACILDRTEAMLAAKRAVLIKDGSSAIDLSKISADKLRLLDKGWCAVYADAKFEYELDRVSAVAGAVILTPFRLYAQSWRGGSALESARDREWSIAN